MADFITTLQQRGMLHTMTPGLSKCLHAGTLRAYIGFDPTASSLHVGNLATLMLLKQLQLAGHQPILVIGGATGMIGDPSFKAAERSFLDKETLLHNQAAIKTQVSRFLDFEGPHAAILLNNHDWFAAMDVLTFLRETGKALTINYMMAKDSVRNRLTTGLSYTEFTYQLLQAYDFYYLYKQYGVRLQMGGADQWGNITTGIELIRKKTQGEVHGLTTPLITKADGTKFGKTETGNVWLDSQLTSPYVFYQFWLNCRDEEADQLLPRMTLCSIQEIEDVRRAHEAAPYKRYLQHALANAVTRFVHGERNCQEARRASDLLFGESNYETLAELSSTTLLQALAGVPHIRIEVEELSKINTVTDLLCYGNGSAPICQSRRAARELIAEGAIQLNMTNVTEGEAGLENFSWLHGRYLLIRRGKKNFYLIEVAGPSKNLL